MCLLYGRSEKCKGNEEKYQMSWATEPTCHWPVFSMQTNLESDMVTIQYVIDSYFHRKIKTRQVWPIIEMEKNLISDKLGK